MIKSVECVHEDDKDVERFVETLVEQLPASKERMEQFRKAQEEWNSFVKHRKTILFAQQSSSILRTDVDFEFLL